MPGDSGRDRPITVAFPGRPAGWYFELAYECLGGTGIPSHVHPDGRLVGGRAVVVVHGVLEGVELGVGVVLGVLDGVELGVDDGVLDGVLDGVGVVEGVLDGVLLGVELGVDDGPPAAS